MSCNMYPSLERQKFAREAIPEDGSPFLKQKYESMVLKVPRIAVIDSVSARYTAAELGADLRNARETRRVQFPSRKSEMLC
jgi:RecA/RadA recombinase